MKDRRGEIEINWGWDAQAACIYMAKVLISYSHVIQAKPRASSQKTKKLELILLFLFFFGPESSRKFINSGFRAQEKKEKCKIITFSSIHLLGFICLSLISLINPNNKWIDKKKVIPVFTPVPVFGRNAFISLSLAGSHSVKNGWLRPGRRNEVRSA